MRSLLTATLVSIAAASPTAAQTVIAAGMPRDEVVERLGAPASERTSGEATYLFYAAPCDSGCPVNDLIVLRDGRVSDAIFTSTARRYAATRVAAAGRAHDAGALGMSAERAGLRRGGLVLARPDVASLTAPSPMTPMRVQRSRTATDDDCQRAADPGPLYPPHGDPTLNEPAPLRVRTFVLPGTFAFAEPRRFHDYSPGSAQYLPSPCPSRGQEPQ